MLEDSAGAGMLNPSVITPVAGAFPTPADGPTARTCVHFSKKLGCGGMITANVFAFRAKNPDDLRSCPDPVGPHNDATLLRLIDEADIVLGAWGTSYPPQYQPRVDHVRDMLRAKGASCLGKTKKGQPRHPRAVPYTTQLVPL